MSEDIKCIDCGMKIKIVEKSALDYCLLLKKEEKISELNSLINNHNYQKIHSCICINCLHEYIHLMKQKTEEAKTRHNKCMISLKDLLLDISNQENIDKIMHSILNEKEIINLYNNYCKLKTERIDLEEKINKDKKELVELKNYEQNLCIQLNKNKREAEEHKEIMNGLNKKLKNLKKQYEELIKEDK